MLLDTEAAGLKELAEKLRGMVDWRRAELQVMLVRPGGVLAGARLQGQDLSRLMFATWSLKNADLRDCDLIECDFRSADLRGTNLSGADCSAADLNNANLRNAKLRVPACHGTAG